ncbi:gypsy type transposase [Tanacetum coccineum]
MAILDRRLGKVNNKPVMFVLIQWTNKSVKEATWEIYGDLITRFPGFDAVNEVFAKYQKINHTTSISAWFEGVSVKKDHLPLEDSVDLPCMKLLNDNRTVIRKYPELFLSVIGLSRSFVDDDVRPTFLRNDDEEIGLLDFIKSDDPFKAKVGARTLAEKEVPLLTKTKDKAILLLLKLSGGIVISKPNPTTAGKTPAAMRKLISHSGQDDIGSGSTAHSADNFVSSFVTLTLEHDYQDDSGAAQGGNVRTHPAFERYVVLTSSSEPEDTDEHASQNVASPIPYVHTEAEAVAYGFVKEIGASYIPANETATSSIPRYETSGSSSALGGKSSSDDFYQS